MRLSTLPLPIVLALVLVGCAPKDPLLLQAQFADQAEYQQWVGTVSTELSPEQSRDFKVALQEIKFDVMMRDKVKGSDAQELATMAKVKGASVRQVIVKGLELKQTRLENDRKACEEQKREDDKLVTRAGDVASAAALAKLKKDHADFFERVLYELDQTEKALSRYQMPPAK